MKLVLCRKIKQGEAWTSYPDSGIWQHKIIKYGDSIPVDYEDIISTNIILGWQPHAEYLVKNEQINDIQVVRRALHEAFLEKTWTNCSNDEKDFLIQYSINENSTDIITHMVTNWGYTQYEATEKMLDLASDNNDLAAKSNQKREKYIKKTIFKYIKRSDAEALINNSDISKLFHNYKDYNLIGENYGDSVSAIADFIEGTNDYLENGIADRGYTLNFGTWNMCQDELIDIIVYGIIQ